MKRETTLGLGTLCSGMLLSAVLWAWPQPIDPQAKLGYCLLPPSARLNQHSTQPNDQGLLLLFALSQGPGVQNR